MVTTSPAIAIAGMPPGKGTFYKIARYRRYPFADGMGSRGPRYRYLIMGRAKTRPFFIML